MKNDIKLYLNGQLADLPDNIALNYNYQSEDFTDPAAVKNNYSLTIALPGTSANNKIFNEIYKIDRVQSALENYYNPSVRTPFELYKNSDLIESGYFQLSTIKVKNKNEIEYNINLYGGLGDFFYNLAYTEDGDNKSLKDLVYGIVDASGNTLPADSEMDFILNKDFVNNCWNNINIKNNKLYSVLTFVPSYNGIYDNFDNDKVLINTKDSKIFTTTSTTVSGTTYSTVNGYALGEMNNEYDEWVMRDLRSYMQRPALRFYNFIQAICNSENNGGYEVELDDYFFNDNNPYYRNSYILLPSFSTSYQKTENQVSDTDIILLNNENYEVGYSNSQATFNLGITPTSDITFNSTTYEIDYSSIPLNAKSNFEINFSVEFLANNPEQVAGSDILYTEYVVKNSAQASNNPINYVFKILDEAGNILSKKTIQLNGTIFPETTSGGEITYVNGYFKNDGNDNFYYYSTNGNNTFNISFEDIYSPNNKVYIELDAYFSWQKGVQPTTEVSYSYTKIYGDVKLLLDNTNSLITIKYDDELGSGARMNKTKVLTTEKTPLDYLLDFTKMFNLNFYYESNSKKIKILTKNNFYKNEIIDIDNYVDYSEITITPLLFEDKFLRLKYENDEDNYYLNKYNNDYNITYGQKRLKTGYNFNNNTKDLLEDNVYENVIQVTDNSKYYRDFFDKNGNQVPPFLTDNLSYNLFNGDNSTSIEISGADIINLNNTVEYTKQGYDFFDKPAFYSLENNVKNLSDISSSFIFYNTKKLLLDANDNIVYYYLTDDVPEMYELNDNPCYLYTESATNEDGDTIAIQLQSLPQFSRYVYNKNNITYSYDFEQPLELYVQDVNYNDNCAIYNRYWKNYLYDQFSENCKKISCKVNLNNFNIVNNDTLRKFYYFSNSIWLLNKIENYNLNSYDTTQCEFVKVNNINNYLYGQYVEDFLTVVDNSQVNIEYNVTNVSLTIYSNSELDVETSNPGVTFNENNLKPGTNQLIVTLPTNDGYNNKQYTVRLVDEGGNTTYVNIIQSPNPDIVVNITGTVSYSDGSSVSGLQVWITNENMLNITTVDSSTGKYSMFAPKNQDFEINIHKGISIIYADNISASASDITYNITVYEIIRKSMI